MINAITFNIVLASPRSYGDGDPYVVMFQSDANKVKMWHKSPWSHYFFMLTLPVDAATAPIIIGGTPSKRTRGAAIKQVILAVADEEADRVLWWKLWHPRLPRDLYIKQRKPLFLYIHLLLQVSYAMLVGVCTAITWNFGGPGGESWTGTWIYVEAKGPKWTVMDEDEMPFVS